MLFAIARPLIPIAMLAVAFFAVATRGPVGRCEWVAAEPGDPPCFIPGYEKIKLRSPSRDCAICHQSPRGPRR
jgi:hypothetical protein